MHISELSIRNFRNFKNSKFKFSKGINTLIGENGSGKTNAFYAIRLLLDNSLPINASKLIDSDFNWDISDWQGHWIIIRLEFNELGSSEAAGMLAHKMEHVEDYEDNGSYSMYFRPKYKIRKKLFELSTTAQEKKEITGTLSTITIDDYESVYCFRGKADFNDDTLYQRLVGDFANLKFPDPDEDDSFELGNQTSHILLIKNEIVCTFIKALRNVVADLKQARNSPLLNLLRGTAKKIEIKDSEEISTKVLDLNTKISELEEIKILTNKVKASLNSTLGYTYSPNVSIKSELPEDINKLLNSLTLWVGDGDEGKQGKLEELSLGGANLIYITLKLLEYEYKQPTDEKAAHFLLIEEPEAHIHTHIQKTIFDKYHFMNTQVITSTHSTHISSASKISAINVFSKGNNESIVCHPSNGLSDDECSRIERYLDAVRTTLLFAKGVILVEGDAELIIIPEMFKKVFGLSLDEIGISLINMSSTVFDHIAKLFHEDRLHRNCAIITDGDMALISLPPDKSDDSKEQRDARNSQDKGLERKEKLNSFCKDNRWVEAFYAEHTFEVDFILNSNDYEIVQTLDKIYKRSVDREKAKLKLESSDPVEQGKEVLRLAEKEGKGWFALIVAEQIISGTFIPTYILEAIAFASNHISEKHLIKMASYIINEEKEDDRYIKIHHKLTRIKCVKEVTISDILENFKEFAPDDQLLTFYNLLQANEENQNA